MKRDLLTLLMIVLCGSAINAQSTMEKTLEEKYGWACEHTDDGRKWYSVGKDGRGGACDDKGKLLVPLEYDNVSVDYEEGYIKAIKNKKTTIFDINGKVLVQTEYEDVRWYQMEIGYCEVEKDEKIGVINRQGKIVIPCEYDGTRCFQFEDGDYCEVEKDGKWGVFNKEGNLVVPCDYDVIYIWQFKDGSYCKVKKNGQWGFVDKRGKELLPCGKYEYISPIPQRYTPVSKGIVLKYGNNDMIEEIVRNGKWGIYDLEAGKELISPQFDYIGHEQEGIFAFNKGGFLGNNEISSIKGGKWGYIDTTGKEIIPAQYDAVSDFEDGVAQVTKDGVVSMLAHPLTGASVQMDNGISIAVDGNIPQTDKTNENSFAFIIANENYTHLAGADYAINDGKVFASYCKKTLGIPERNVRYYEDATFGNIINAVKRIQDIADVYEGEATIIFYFSGLGATDSKSMEKYILATDASLAALTSTGYSVAELLKVLNELKTVYTWVVLDAPFSNVDKNGKTLASTRGVAVKPKAVNPQGNVIVSMASNNEESAYADKKYGHGLFTYGLLEKLQQTKGNCTLKEMTDYAKQWTKKTALKMYDKVQEPVTNASETMNYKWDNIRF